jgi:hypothetical protein
MIIYIYYDYLIFNHLKDRIYHSLYYPKGFFLFQLFSQFSLHSFQLVDVLVVVLLGIFVKIVLFVHTDVFYRFIFVNGPVLPIDSFALSREISSSDRLKLEVSPLSVNIHLYERYVVIPFFVFIFIVFIICEKVKYHQFFEIYCLN